MNLRRVKTIYLKELIDVLRDKRIIFVTILLPLLLYPVMVLTVGRIAGSQIEKLRKSTFKVAIQNEASAPKLVAQLKNTEQVELVAGPSDMERTILDGKIELAILLPENFQALVDAGKPVEVKLLADLSNEKSKFAKDKVDKVLEEFKAEKVVERLKARGFESDLIKPFEIVSDNLASAKKMGASFVGKFLPYILIILIFATAMFPAIDLTAGEKERRTIETLIITPTSRFEIVMGKYFAVLTIAMIGSVITLGSMGLSLSKSFSSPTQKLDFALSPQLIVVVCLMMIPLAALFSALAMAISICAKSFREAHGYMSSLMFVVLFPAMASLFPGVELTLGLSLVPILNVSLLAKKLALGFYPLREIALVFLSTALFAYFAIRFTVNVFQREDVLLRTSSDIELNWRSLLSPRLKQESPSVGLITILFLLVLALQYYVGGLVSNSRSEKWPANHSIGINPRPGPLFGAHFRSSNAAHTESEFNIPGRPPHRIFRGRQCIVCQFGINLASIQIHYDA